MFWKVSLRGSLLMKRNTIVMADLIVIVLTVIIQIAWLMKVTVSL
jgi:hypothetical protein